MFNIRFKHDECRLHILINNAGIVGSPYTKTSDGLEVHMATNHFGHFLLTNLLLDTLKFSAPSRIINLTSVVHKLGRIQCDDLNMEKSYRMWSAYFNSKLANILFTRALAKRLTGTRVTANSVHPGIVSTDVQGKIPIIGHLTFLIYPFRFFMRTAESGAQTTVMLAVDPELEDVSGKYFVNCQIAEESPQAKDTEMAEWLWIQSEETTGVRFN